MLFHYGDDVISVPVLGLTLKFTLPLLPGFPNGLVSVHDRHGDPIAWATEGDVGSAAMIMGW